jgi:hypothetical protein
VGIAASGVMVGPGSLPRMASQVSQRLSVIKFTPCRKRQCERVDENLQRQTFLNLSRDKRLRFYSEIKHLQVVGL